MKHYLCAVILAAAALTNFFLMGQTDSALLAGWLFIIAVAAMVESALFFVRNPLS